MKRNFLFIIICLVGFSCKKNPIIPIGTGNESLNISKGLISHYSFTNNLFDISENKNHLVGKVEFVEGFDGEKNGGIYFDGKSSYLYNRNPISFPNGNSKYSMSVWFKISEVNSDMLIVGYGPSGQNKSCNYIKINRFKKLNHYHWNLDYEINTDVPINLWNHLVVTYDQTNDYYYLNGKKIGLNKNNSNYSINPSILSVGTRISTLSPFNLQELFKGTIDEFRVYDRCLSEQEVYYLYNSK